MNHRQKLGYMALGAGILAIGIIIGQWTTPGIEAQNNGVFDEITCQELRVVTESGKVGIRLGSGFGGNVISINNKFSRSAMLFFVNDYMSRISIYDNEEKESLRFDALKGYNALTVRNKLGGGNTGVKLTTSTSMNRVEVYDNAGKSGVVLHSDKTSKGVHILGKSDKRAISLTHVPDFKRNSIKISDMAGKTIWKAPKQELFK